jgi:hypothetical protein
MSQDNIYSDIMGELSAHYKENKVDVFVPSLGKTCKFTPISVKQHKDILKTDNDLLRAGLQFNINVNKVILDNSPTDDLLITDRPAVLLALKASHLNNNLSLIIDGERHEVDIKTHTEQFQDIKFDDKHTSAVLNLDKFEVHCNIPTLGYDIHINEKIKAQMQGNSTGSLADSVGELFVYEMIKYITHVKSDTLTLDLKELTFSQQISICEMIPLSLSDKIIQYINRTRETELPYITCKNIKDEHIKLPLSVTLFAGD